MKADEKEEEDIEIPDDPLTRAVNFLQEPKSMSLKQAKEKNYRAMHFFISDDYNHFCWTANLNKKNKADALPIDCFNDVEKGPPRKVKGKDEKQPDFENSTFTLLHARNDKHSIDMWANNPELCESLYQASGYVIQQRQRGEIPDLMRIEAASIANAKAKLQANKMEKANEEKTMDREERMANLKTMASQNSLGSERPQTGIMSSSLMTETIEEKKDERSNVTVGGMVVPQLPHDLQSSIHAFQMDGFANNYFGSQKTWGFLRRRNLTTEEMVSFANKSISKPLLKVPKNLTDVAVSSFLLIMKYMGDEGQGQKAGDMNLMRELVRTGVREEGLRDEIYCQLVKQSTNNPLPRSNVLGWELIASCSRSFPPTTVELAKTVCQHAESVRMSPNAVGGLASYAYGTLATATTHYEDNNVMPPATTHVLTRQELEDLKETYVPTNVYGNSLEKTLIKELFMETEEISMPSPGSLMEQNVIPKVIMHLCDAVMRLGGGEVDGIYRRASDVDVVNLCKQEINTNGYDVIMAGDILNDPLVAADLLKIFLRELETPLIPFELYERAVESGKKNDIATLRNLWTHLPEAHKYTILHLGDHLAELSEHQSATQMGLDNLALVVAPNLMKNPENDPMLFAANAESEKRFFNMLLHDLENLHNMTHK